MQRTRQTPIDSSVGANRHVVNVDPLIVVSKCFASGSFVDEPDLLAQVARPGLKPLHLQMDAAHSHLLQAVVHSQSLRVGDAGKPYQRRRGRLRKLGSGQESDRGIDNKNTIIELSH